MARMREGNTISYKAGADLSAKQFFVVKRGSDANEVVLASAATDKIVGVLQNDPEENEAASVKPNNASGTGKVHAGGSITKGAYLTSDGDGKAIATTTAGNVVFGIAEMGADDDDIIEYTPCYLIHP